jgi:hypothetical protein
MHYFRFIAFLLVIAIFGTFAVFGQKQGSAPSQVPGTAQTQTPQPAPAAQTPQRDSSPNMQPPAPPELTTDWRRIKVKLVPGHTHTVIIKQQRDQPLDPSIDQGIYLRAASGPKACGSIVSYNFSPGDNPQLQSVTTCTPAEGVRTLRTQDEDQKPQGPLLQKTNYSPSPKQ